MKATYLTRGDPLPVTDTPPEPQQTDCPRGLFWGLDLTECTTRKQARHAWHDAVASLKSELDAHPEIRRVCIGCARPQRFPYSVLVGLPEGLALKLHNDLERDRGRYVNTLVLDVSECDDPELLHERLREALCTKAAWSDLTLTWEQVRDSDVHEAWTIDAL